MRANVLLFKESGKYAYGMVGDTGLVVPVTTDPEVIA